MPLNITCKNKPVGQNEWCPQVPTRYYACTVLQTTDKTDCLHSALSVIDVTLLLMNKDTFGLWQKPELHVVLRNAKSVSNSCFFSMVQSKPFLLEYRTHTLTFKGHTAAGLEPTFCFGLTRANTRMWGKSVWSSRGSQLSLASPSPVMHKSYWRTNEDTEGGGTGTRTLPSMDSHCHSPGK